MFALIRWMLMMVGAVSLWYLAAAWLQDDYPRLGTDFVELRRNAAYIVKKGSLALSQALANTGNNVSEQKAHETNEQH